VFGVNLFVWSALLAVTLGALATGYYLGGRFIDRVPTPRVMGFAVTAAGLLLGLERWYAHPVLYALGDWGPRGGPLVAATLLFAPALCVLGATSPIAVRLLVREVAATGRGAGAAYAISTLGSLLGTLAVGFVLVPRFGMNEIIVTIAVLLTVVGVALLTISGRRQLWGAVLVPPVLAWCAPGRTLPPGVRVLESAQSLYGLTEVIEDDRRGVRLLRADHSVIGAQFTRDGSAAFSFLHLLEAVRFARPHARKMLQVGLGVGALARVVQRGGMRVDVVEIDPAVVRFATKYFGYEANGAVYIEDARTLLQRTSSKYDVVVHDTFTGGTTPEHLLSLEVVSRVRSILTAHGLLALNFAGFRAGEHVEASFAVWRTLRAVFPVVRAFWDSPLDKGPTEPGNLTFFASDGPIDFQIPPNALFENRNCEDVQRAFQHWEILEQVPQGPVITDDQNPLASLELPVAEAHFAAMRELLARGVWVP
jgi:predicted membrane-bound spermidine synthase